jgi:exonuclease SbcC
MRLKFIKLKNFKSYPDQETKLDLDFHGVKLVVGQNGSGKTTFFDAIIWGLYGKSMALADDVINWQTGKDCKVEVGFIIGKDLYSVVRYRNHEEHGNKILFFKNKKNVSQRTNGDTQEKIDEVIQISYTAMISSVILSSELYSSFLRSKPSDRLKSLESILSLKDVNEYAKKLKKLRDPLLEEIDKLETDRIKLVSSCETLTTNIDGYNEKVKATLLSLKQQKEELMSKVKEIEIRLIEFREIDVDRELKSNEEYDRVEELNRITKETIEKERLRIKDVVSFATQYNELKHQYEEFNKINIVDELRLIESYDEKIEKNKKIEEGIEKLKNKIVNYSHAEVRIKQLKPEIEKVKNYINELREHNETCPVCKQPVKKELTESLIDEEINKLDSLELEFGKFELEIKTGKDVNKKIEEGISKLKEKEITDLVSPKYTKEFLAKISSNVENLTNQMNSLKEKIKENESYNEEINERIKELKSNLVELNNEPKHHTLFLENLKKKINELELEAEELRNEVIVIDTKAKSSYDKDYVEETKKKIALFTTKVKKIDKLLQTKQLEDRHYEVLAQAFSNKEVGFKKFFINKIIKIFNERVNFYLPFFFDDDIEISFDKDLNEVIKRNKREVNFNSFSSGQKTRFELAISFAMFMLVKTFFSNTVNILVFDEILDRNLDQKGFNSVVEILENLGKNSSIFVVSHQEFYKEKFNHHVQIKLNEEGFSYIYKEV